ncbi:retrovirus-related pol polyprotein from transposon TNT 1-94 [Tanacetum coccineum]|uniref:Retrovirus-related pol polyprotein from transposon TNT 1-94 n=1 Tax=Tanacetum coccineum TaxID=301880 RepID=A0ABQ5HEY5_9ASTR
MPQTMGSQRNPYKIWKSLHATGQAKGLKSTVCPASKQELLQTTRIFTPVKPERRADSHSTIEENCPQYLAEMLKKKRTQLLDWNMGIISPIEHPLTPPQHNGVSERRNRTLLDMVRSMMSQTTLPNPLGYAIETSCTHSQIVFPTKKALVKRDTLTKPDKLEPRSIKCIFIGYPKETMGYSFYYPPENKVLVARNAEFLENSLIDQEASGSLRS